MILLILEWMSGTVVDQAPLKLVVWTLAGHSQ